LEADNAIAVLILSNRHEEMMDAAVRDVNSGASSAARGSFFWTRVQGLFCAAVLVGAMFGIERFVHRCDWLQTFLFATILWPALVIFIGQFIYSIICARRNGQAVGEQIIRALTKCNRNVFALSMALNMQDILQLIRYNRWNNSLLFQVIELTFTRELTFHEEDNSFAGISTKTARKFTIVPTIVSLLLVLGLSMLRRRWYGGADRKPAEHADPHGAGGDGDRAV